MPFAKTVSVLVGLLVLLPSNAESAPKAMDIAAFKDRMIVSHDGKGHYLALAERKKGERHRYFFYGNGKKMYRLRIGSASRSPKMKEWNFIEPRSARAIILKRSAEEDYTVGCFGKRVPFAVVTGL